MTFSDLRFLFFRTLSNLFIISAVFVLVFTYGPILKDNAFYFLSKFRGVEYKLGEGEEGTSFFKALLDKKPLLLKPDNKDFSLVIPKIGLSVPVVKNVTVVDKDAYYEALKSGVAHAKGTALPGEEGNSYFFAHSSINFWDLGPYATSFNLLDKLSPGDEIDVFYNNTRYTYKVLQTEIVDGWDTKPYYKDFGKATITLQTCDPPGTTLNRLLIIGELVQ